MAGVGIVSNPLAYRSRRRPDEVGRLAALAAREGLLCEAATPGALRHALRVLRDRDIDLLAVHGGDGTGHRVLTAAAEAWGEAALPPLLLLRAGAMNNVAESHRVRGAPEAILARALERRRAGAPLRTAGRDLLLVEADGGPPLLGFLVGSGATVVFLDAYYRRRHPGRAAAAGLLARAVGSALAGGRFASELTARERLHVTADGDEWPDLPYLALLAGTVPEIGFGFTPFSRCDEQPGFFHAVGVTGSTLEVAASLPALWLGRPWRRRLAMDAVTRDLEVRGALRFTVDGDLYGARERLRIRTGPSVRIVLP